MTVQELIAELENECLLDDEVCVRAEDGTVLAIDQITRAGRTVVIEPLSS
jgi:hypothetical protein